MQVRVWNDAGSDRETTRWGRARPLMVSGGSGFVFSRAPHRNWTSPVEGFQRIMRSQARTNLSFTSCAQNLEETEEQRLWKEDRTVGNYSAGTKEVQLRNYDSKKRAEQERKDLFNMALSRFKAQNVEEVWGGEGRGSGCLLGGRREPRPSASLGLDDMHSASRSPPLAPPPYAGPDRL